jgi:hypothetical protein
MPLTIGLVIFMNGIIGSFGTISGTTPESTVGAIFQAETICAAIMEELDMIREKSVAILLVSVVLGNPDTKDPEAMFAAQRLLTTLARNTSRHLLPTP